MTALKLTPLNQYPFTCEIQVRVGDLNCGGHVGNSQLIGILHDARVALFRAMGVCEADLGDGKTGIITDDLVINFRSEAFLGDKLKIECALSEIEQASFRLHYHVTQTDRTVAVAETGIVSFNYVSRTISFLPAVFKENARAFVEAPERQMPEGLVNQ